MFVCQLLLLSRLSAVPPGDAPQQRSFHSAETKCSTKRWDLKRVSGERHDNSCFLSVSFIRDSRNDIVRGRNVDLMLSRNWKAEGGEKKLVRPLSGKDLQKPDCKLTGFVTLHLCLCLFVPASLPIVSQKLLLKEVFLYWGDNKLLIVLQALQSFLPSTTSLFVFAQFQELSHFCVWLPMSVVRVEVKCIRVECELPHLTISHYSWHGCIMLDWFSCFCLSPGNYILCSLCCWI